MEAEQAAKTPGEAGGREVAKYGYYVLHVKDLTFVPRKTFARTATDFLRRYLTGVEIGWILPSLKKLDKDSHHDAPLHRVHFSFKSGEVTALLGDKNERHTLINLLTGRQKTGQFDGDISLTGPGLRPDSYYYDNMAFVQSKVLYSPGLTYMEMLRFAVELRLKPVDGVNINAAVEARVNELVQLFNLSACKNHVMPAFPEERGESSGDMRRLAIAMEIADLPPVIVIDEPTKGLDVGLSLNLMLCIRDLALRGHVVICSMSKPFAQELELIDNVVLLSEGWSVFASNKRDIKPYFTSPAMGYELRADVDLSDFLIDVANGTERPVNTRAAELPFIMQQKFEESDYCRAVRNYSEISVSAFSKDFFHMYGYGRFDGFAYAVRRIRINTKRAFYTKTKDADQLKFNLVGPVFIGCLYGYLNYNTGSQGPYCMSLLSMPYAKTTNISGLFFFTAAFSFMLPHVSSHVVCQKVELFRYEQESNLTSSLAFIIASLASEVPYTVVGSLMFASIIYGLSDLGAEQDDYFYYMEVMIILGLLGISGAYMMALLIRKELLIRDLMLIIVTLCAMLSGFPVLLTTMKDYIQDAAGLNPIRWAFEGLMSWKFTMYEDGDAYLGTYTFQTFRKDEALTVLNNFIWITFGLAIILTTKYPNLLRRLTKQPSSKGVTSTSRDSMDSVEYHEDNRNSFLPRKSTRQSELVKPVVFSRESSVTGKMQHQLSINLSLTGEANTDRGPTVAFKDLNFRVIDKTSPGGYRIVLNRVSGQFDWGKLSMVMGAAGSGKSSLMHILAGDVAVGSEITGRIFFNEKPVNNEGPLWARCGFVPIHNEHYRDLTVQEIVKYAMLLRCHNHLGLPVVDDNVNKTMSILHLDDVANKKTKFLNTGELKRVSIAEEMVHGPKLLLMDEPLTGVSMNEVSILMNTFREMVNQDRTVIATVHQPSHDVFKLFDSVLLLSKGRVIYFGAVGNASNYFTSSPFSYNLSTYNNPADFFADVSGGFICDAKGEFLEAAILEHHFKQTEPFSRLRIKLKRAELQALGANDGTSARTGSEISNPMARASDVEKGSLSMNSQPDVAVSVTLDPDGDDENGINKSGAPAAPWPLQIQGALLPLQELASIFSSRANLDSAVFKGYVLFYRSIYTLFNRKQLLVSSNVIHIALSVLFGWFMGDSSGSAGMYNTAAFLALSCMFLILNNIPIGFFMFNNHGVFLKEHARGLYPNVLKWAVTDYPLYLLRMVNATVFFSVAWAMINQTTEQERYGFSLLCYITFVLTSVAMAEYVIFAADTKRQFYEGITFLAFANILLSGLLIKASTMPEWVSPWAPSISLVRWSMQANFINIYDDANILAVLPNGYSIYSAFLSLYGWGGKTKWECWGNMVIILVIFKMACLWSSATSAMGRKGGAKFRQVIAHNAD